MSHREHGDPSKHDADAAMDRAWREASAETPPPLVDARILAAARDAITRREPDASAERHAKSQSRSRWTWRPLLAAAAVAGIAFAILPSLLRQAERPVPSREERSTNVPTAAQPVQPQIDARVPAPSQPESNAAEAPSSTAGAPSAASASSGPAAPATMPVERESRAPESTEAAITAKSVESAAPAGESGALSHADRALPSAPASASRSPALATPTDRAAKVAALYESGDVTAAATELRAFRATQPDADTYLPGALQNWARTVK